jgi:hypothetical protein
MNNKVCINLGHWFSNPIITKARGIGELLYLALPEQNRQVQKGFYGGSVAVNGKVYVGDVEEDIVSTGYF